MMMMKRPKMAAATAVTVAGTIAATMMAAMMTATPAHSLRSSAARS
jgi:hypothetical protein